MTFWQQLNPRLHVAAAIAWAVFFVVTVAALMAANLAAAQAEQRARTDAEGLLAELATQVRDALSMNLETRRSVLQATAAQITASSDEHKARARQTLDTLKGEFPEFVWLGLTDAKGRVEAETSGHLTDADASRLPWFVQGGARPYVSEVHTALPGMDAASSDGAPELMDYAVPLNPAVGSNNGVLAANLAWPWVERVVTKMQAALGQRRQLEVMVAARDGALLIAPARWLGLRLGPETDLTEAGAYVVGTRTQLRLADGLGLGWTAIVRQPADVALAPVRTTRRTVFLTVFLAGLLSAGAAALATRWLTRRLSRLAVQAEAVRRGEQTALVLTGGRDEVSQIGATLALLVSHLQSEKQALQALNVELDQRVADRTRQIERMADEARHAAVNRERLRIARDLHDTLAHSLMALLTQVRLVRKLRSRMDSDELDAELGRAEAVATSGLSEARAAIAQMRDNGVREAGLGVALQDLVKRFGQRTGVAVALETDAEMAAWADDRSETLFRIIEEALRNVERHAQARAVRIQMDCAAVASLRGVQPEGAPPRLAHIEVKDDGLGFDPSLPVPGHFGLRGMREQAALIDAALTIESRPGQGTRVVLDFLA